MTGQNSALPSSVHDSFLSSAFFTRTSLTHTILSHPYFNMTVVMNMSVCFLRSCRAEKTSHKGKEMVERDC